LLEANYRIGVGNVFGKEDDPSQAPLANVLNNGIGRLELLPAEAHHQHLPYFDVEAVGSLTVTGKQSQP